MAGDSKDTIYIEVDEEITGIVSKVQKSPKDIVALVLPKRASVLQSIVNMKLLKRAQDQNDKKVVLITSEGRILPLAGAAGLFVASNLTSKPYIPPSPKLGGNAPVSTDDEVAEIDPNTPISQVAPDAKFADPTDEIEIDNTPKAPTAGEAAASAKDKSKKNKKSKVPNFSKFRKKIIFIALGVLLLIFFLVYGIFIAPKAKVTVKAQTNDLPLNLDFVADPNAAGFDSTNKVVRASLQNTQKDDNEKVNASGQKDKGNKASGTVVIYNCNQNDTLMGKTRTVPAGTGISSGNLTFITSKSVSVQPSTYTGFGGTCNKDKPSASVSVTAQDPGDQYNVSAQPYSVSGHSSMSADGSSMNGGTTKIVKVVTQSDVDKAKERLNGKPNTAHDEFKAQLEKDGYIPIEDSFKAKPGKYDISPSVDDEGDEVTVSVTNTYTMLGIKKEDIQQLVKDEVSKQEQGKGQSILSDGIDQATFKLSDARGVLQDGQVAVTVDTKVVTGPDLNQDNIKQQIAGKKSGEAEEILGQISGITDPKVKLSPFWVGKIPKSNSKITIEIQQSDGSQIP